MRLRGGKDRRVQAQGTVSQCPPAKQMPLGLLGEGRSDDQIRMSWRPLGRPRALGSSSAMSRSGMGASSVPTEQSHMLTSMKTKPQAVHAENWK